jgi:short-subunit dehydrogenase
MEPRGATVWITGASSGIGEALAVEMAAAGAAELILSARRVERLEEVAGRCRAAGARVRVLPLDMAETASLPQAAAQAWDGGGAAPGVDILVLNAGVGQRSLALETAAAVDEAIMRTNWLGMLQRGSGQLVVTSSVLGRFGVQRRSAYAASKHALHGYFDSLRCELAGRGVTITLICPGWVRTGISQAAFEGDGRPHGRLDPGQAGGMDPALFARKMLRAIRRGRREAVIGGREAWGVLAQRLVPGLLARLLPRMRIV